MTSWSKETEENTGNLLLLVEHGTADVCKRHVQKFPGAIREKNQRGETALHIAAGNPNMYAKVSMLLDAGADVNAKNYWGQTPLHYAAEARSEEIIRHLLLEANVDVSCKDANGYTALHYSVISTQKIDGKWKKCLDYFVEAGIDINSKTNIGRSILHQVSQLYERLDFLRHIFRKYPEVNIFSVDLEGKNFLHIFNEFNRVQTLDIIEDIAQCQHKDKLKTLLNQKDFSGITPWMKILDDSFESTKDLEKLVTSYGAYLHSTDNLKNTALHILSTWSGHEERCRYIEMLIKLGLDANSKNIFGQTALSLSCSEDTLDAFLKCSFDFETCDRWNRTPFLEIMCHGFYPPVLEMLLRKHGTYIDQQDMFDSTPLHFAAYLGDVYKIKLLLKYTEHANRKFVLDKMNDIPSDTALRHGNLECYQHLLEGTSAFEDGNTKILLYKAPRFVDSFALKGRDDIRKLLKDFPKDMKKYSEHLLLTKHITNRQSPENTEDSDIILAVNNLVSRICDHVKSYDSRFKMSVFQTGSTAEGTKVGQPDEFDFALCIETLSQNCEIEIPAKPEHSQYVCLRFKENAVSEYISFSNEKRFFIALPFLHYLFRYLRRALKKPDLWVSGNLFMRPDDPLCVLMGKPVFNFNMYWNGSKYKQLRISMDLVPVVYIRGWWPSFIPTNSIKLVTDDVKDAGCFVMLQTKTNEFDKCWHIMNDNINTTCKRNEESEVDGKETDHFFQRISVAPAEIALMKSLPEQFRKAYALAKIVKRTEICPEVNLDDIPLFLHCATKDGFRPFIVSPSEEIKSYWLKNSLFYVAEEIASTACEEMAPIDITKLIYEKLMEFASSCQLNAYLFPQSDILAHEKSKAMSTNEVHKLLLTRKVCIDTVLGILGRTFPDDNSEWIRKCETKYQQYNLSDEEHSSRYPIAS